MKKAQKNLEFSIANVLESTVILENYPGTLTRITLSILSDDGSVYKKYFFLF